MADDLGLWLREQRQARGWSAAEMARKLQHAARANGDTTLPGIAILTSYIRRWEHGAISPGERYQLHYCKALCIRPEQINLPCSQGRPPGTPGLSVLPPAVTTSVTVTGPGMVRVAPRPDVAPSAVDYRWTQGPDAGRSLVEREVLMAAHEGGERAERAERRDIGDGTLEQLRADVTRLSHEFMTQDPFPLFREMRRVRSRIYAALDRQLWPRDARELYFLLGALNFLMAAAAEDLGSTQAAEELIRSGWAYAVAIDHRPLMAHLRYQLASIADWGNRPREARDLAASGLEYLSSGPIAALLHLKYARATARLGDADTARLAIAAAEEARDRSHDGELEQIGGEFDLSQASQRYLAGSVLIEIPEAIDQAVTELEHAAALYSAGPQPGETHGYAMEALTYVNLAAAQLRADQLDAAAATASSVLSLPPEKRIAALPQRFDRVRSELARHRYQDSPEARELDERIEEFCRETILRELPAGLSRD
jgi:hypothetical protein